MSATQIESAAAIVIDIAVEAGDWGEEFELRPEVERILSVALKVGQFDVPPLVEVSLVLTDDAHIRELNRTWRGKDKATNVLSFPASDGEAEETEAIDGKPMMLGDIVIARETLAAEAVAEKKRIEDHFCHLLVHGFVHLMGYDHETDDEAEEMEALETEILADLGVEDPYADPPA